MIVGDPRVWDDFFGDRLVPLVLAHVLRAWDLIEAPVPDALENDVSRRLFCALLNSKDRQQCPYLIRWEDLEIDTALRAVTGRKDIAFYPSTEENIYFCIEAKRLNALVGGRWRSLASEYVKDGMQRFVDRQYGRAVLHGGMLGYVLDGTINSAIASVAENIASRCESLRMRAPAEFLPSSARPADPNARETRHERVGDDAVFCIHHLFVAPLVRTTSGGARVRKTRRTR